MSESENTFYFPGNYYEKTEMGALIAEIVIISLLVFGLSYLAYRIYKP